MLHLDILNSICQVVAHLDSWFKSCCNVVWPPSGVFMVLYIIQSSANRRSWLCIPLAMSLMYTRKSVGPSTDP